MKIISQKELGYMPNGTVYSEITDPNFKIYNGDAEIRGLHIICGHDNAGYFSAEGGHFNGVLHMLEYVTHSGTECLMDADEWDTATDTTEFDYDKDKYFVVYSSDDIKAIINNLQWALGFAQEGGKLND